MTAIAPERGAHLATFEKLFRSVKAIRELPNGYVFQLADEPDVLRLAAEFITLERLCCPFCGFGIEVESDVLYRHIPGAASTSARTQCKQKSAVANSVSCTSRR